MSGLAVEAAADPRGEHLDPETGARHIGGGKGAWRSEIKAMRLSSGGTAERREFLRSRGGVETCLAEVLWLRLALDRPCHRFSGRPVAVQGCG